MKLIVKNLKNPLETRKYLKILITLLTRVLYTV